MVAMIAGGHSKFPLICFLAEATFWKLNGKLEETIGRTKEEIH